MPVTGPNRSATTAPTSSPYTTTGAPAPARAATSAPATSPATAATTSAPSGSLTPGASMAPGAQDADAPATGRALHFRMDQMKEYRPGSIDYVNHVHRIVPDAELRFDALPLSGTCSQRPWSDDYWSKANGGLAFRWRTGEKHNFALPTKDQLKAMPPNEQREYLNNLSPAEKYDLLCGNFDFPFTNHMRSSCPASTPAWQGYCHGWAMAAIHFKEPKPVDIVSPDGLPLHFGTSDIKALLTFLQGEISNTRYNAEFTTQTRTMGINNPGAKPEDPRAYDVNPGSFHALLCNSIGMRDQAFGIDCDNAAQKWNQPVHTYDATVLGTQDPDEHASHEAVKQLVVRANVTYTVEIPPHEERALGTPRHHDRTETYHYTVELDNAGKICGGQWLAQLDDGSLVSYHDALDYLRNESGKGDADVKAIMENVFRFPDYAYMQDKAKIASEDTFKQADSSYAFLSNDKRKLWHYFAKLNQLVDVN